MKAIRHLFFFLLLFSSACVIETVPLPDQNDQVLDANDDPTWVGSDGAPRSESSLYYTQSPVILVGVALSLPADATVVVDNPSRNDWQSSTPATSEGDFSLPLNAAVGETVIVTILDGDVEFDSFDFYLAPASADASSAGQEFGEAADTDVNEAGPTLSVSTPDIDGYCIVIGDEGLIGPGLNVVVSNLIGGDSLLATTFDDGSLEAELKAEVGDEIIVFVIEPASSNAGSTPTYLIVPEN